MALQLNNNMAVPDLAVAVPDLAVPDAEVPTATFREILDYTTDLATKIKEEVEREENLLNLEQVKGWEKKSHKEWKTFHLYIVRVLCKFCPANDITTEALVASSLTVVSEEEGMVILNQIVWIVKNHKVTKAMIADPDDDDARPGVNESTKSEKEFLWAFLLQQFPELDCIPTYDLLSNKKFPDATGWKQHDPRIRKAPTKLIDLMEEDRFNLIIGDIQGGKSNAMLALAISHIFHGRSAILTVCNKKGHIAQIVDSFNLMMTKIYQIMKDKGVDFKPINIIDCSKIDQVRAKAKFIDAINGKKPALIVNLANSVQFNRMIRLITTEVKLVHKEYVWIVDEADALLYPNQSEKAEKSLKDAVDAFRELPGLTYAITATPAEILAREDQLMNTNIVQLRGNARHLGLRLSAGRGVLYRKLVHDKIDLVDDEKEGQNMAITDPDFIPFYDEFARRPAWGCGGHGKNDFEANEDDEDDDEDEGCYPNIALHVNSKFQATMTSTINWMKVQPNYKSFALISYMGDGIHMYIPGIHKDVKLHTPDGKDISSSKHNDLLHFKGAHIPDALQFLKDNGGVDKFSHVVIFTGFLANRGIRFVSRDFGWHCSDQYMRVSKGTTVSTMMQYVRVLGIFKDSVPVTLWTTKQVCVDLIKGDARMAEAINRLTNKMKTIKKGKRESPAEQKLRIAEMERVNAGKMFHGLKFNINKKTHAKLVSMPGFEEQFVDGPDGGLSSKVYDRLLEKHIKPMFDVKPDVEKKKDVEEEGGWFISKPAAGKNLDMYNIITAHLKDKKGEWTLLKDLRKLNDENYLIYLHNNADPSYKTSGLVWRQQGGKGTSIEYCLL